MRKRRKKARDLLSEKIVPMGDLDVVDEMAPEDLTKKKRRRRRKTILNEEKGQEERAEGSLCHRSGSLIITGKKRKGEMSWRLFCAR